MSRIRIQFAEALVVLAVLLVSCSIGNSPESVALAAAEKHFQSQGIPYKDLSVLILKNDGTYATVRVVAWVRPTAQSHWEEESADIEVRNVGGQWRANTNIVFDSTPAEQQRKQDRERATATTEAAKVTTKVAATTAAIANGEASGTILKPGQVRRSDGTEVLLRNPTFIPYCNGFVGFEMVIVNTSSEEKVVDISNKDFSMSDNAGGSYSYEWFKQAALGRENVAPTPKCDFGGSNDLMIPLIPAGQSINLAMRVFGTPSHDASKLIVQFHNAVINIDARWSIDIQR